MAATKQVLKLYREMLHNAAKFESYSYRNYAQRRVKEEFHKNKSLAQGSAEQQKALEFAKSQADLIKRQAMVSRLYPPQVRSVMESH